MPKYTLNGVEAEARERYVEGRDRIDKDWSGAELAALNCLKADWSSARTRDEWGVLCEALEGWCPDKARWKTVWNRLVRSGLVYSEVYCYERRYGWNFS